MTAITTNTTMKKTPTAVMPTQNATTIFKNIFFRIQTRYLTDYNRIRENYKRLVQHQGCHQSGGRVWFGDGFAADGSGFEAIEDFSFPIRDLSNDSPRPLEDQAYTYNFDDIDRISTKLGIPWEKSKDVPFSSSVVYIGLQWDLAHRTVGLPLSKREKYLDSISEWQSRATHSLNDVQRVYGRLLHASLVIPSGRSRLVGLEGMLGLYSTSPHVPRHATKSIAPDLAWWEMRLRRELVERPIPIMVDAVDIGAFSDASSEVGIAIVIGNRWRAWRLLPGWKTLNGVRDIGWAEAIGFELLVDAALLFCKPGDHIRLYGDNKGIVEGWWNARSRNVQVNEVFKSILDKLEHFGSVGCVHTAYVPSESNPADAPSRGLFDSIDLLLPPLPIPSCAAGFLIDALDPLTPAELQLQRAGKLPSPRPVLRHGDHRKSEHSNDWDIRPEWGSCDYAEAAF